MSALRAGSPISRRPPTTNAPTSPATVCAATTASGKLVAAKDSEGRAGEDDAGRGWGGGGGGGVREGAGEAVRDLDPDEAAKPRRWAPDAWRGEEPKEAVNHRVNGTRTRNNSIHRC